MPTIPFTSKLTSRFNRGKNKAKKGFLSSRLFGGKPSREANTSTSSSENAEGTTAETDTVNADPSTAYSAAIAASASTDVQADAEPAASTFPPFVLTHAPLLWLHKDERYWPGSPVEHLKHLTPHTFEGDEIAVPPEVKGTPAMLATESIKKHKGNVFLTFPDVRDSLNSGVLTSPEGKPEPSGKSQGSPCVIVVVDKTQMFAAPTKKDGDDSNTGEDIWDKECRGKRVHDVFYFYFFPFNLGNKVLFQNFGNHVGDWEHNMIRFVEGTPRWMHYSAHSDGHAWTWDALEKSQDGNRPLTYVAGGSHANYPSSGTHAYSPVPIFGPKDYTSKGFLWDPLKNWLGARANTWAEFQPAVSSNSSVTIEGLPGYCTTISIEDLLAMLRFEGRWGNSFSQLRKEKAFSSFGGRSKKKESEKGKDAEDAKPEDHDESHNPITKLLDKAEEDVVAGEASKIASSIQEGTIKSPEEHDRSGHDMHVGDAAGPSKDPAEEAAKIVKEQGGGGKDDGEGQKEGKPAASLSLYQRLLLLIWAEGPSGPRDKSLGRKMVNRWTDGFLTKVPR